MTVLACSNKNNVARLSMLQSLVWFNKCWCEGATVAATYTLFCLQSQMIIMYNDHVLMRADCLDAITL